jgi:hypothetical protein
VNDNGPVFPGEMLGWLDEDREPEAFVLRAEATDRDDPQTGNAQLEYSLVRNKELNGQPIFRIEPDTGKIFATVGGRRIGEWRSANQHWSPIQVRLDREQLVERHFRIQVRAVDRGLPQREGWNFVVVYGAFSSMLIFLRPGQCYHPGARRQRQSARLPQCRVLGDCARNDAQGCVRAQPVGHGSGRRGHVSSS